MNSKSKFSAITSRLADSLSRMFGLRDCRKITEGAINNNGKFISAKKRERNRLRRIRRKEEQSMGVYLLKTIPFVISPIMFGVGLFAMSLFSEADSIIEYVLLAIISIPAVLLIGSVFILITHIVGIGLVWVMNRSN